MKYLHLSILTIFLFQISSHCLAQPYSGTIFIDPDIITSADSSTLVSTTYTGQGMRTVYDRRIPGFVTINAYLFDIVWNDGLTSEAQINPEFGSVAAATVEAEKYALVIGRLPTCSRTDVDALWIHMGTEPFGGGNHSILIHTGQSALYEAQGILEETLVHESSHTSLDAAHAAAPGWLAAQSADPTFISTYAAANPTTEDVAESFLTWLAVRQCNTRISQLDYDTIIHSIPNRITYFDNQNFNMYPLCMTTGINEIAGKDFSVFPNPTSNMLNIQTKQCVQLQSVEIFSMEGKRVLKNSLAAGEYSIPVYDLENGIYLLIVTCKDGSRFEEKWMKD